MLLSTIFTTNRTDPDFDREDLNKIKQRCYLPSQLNSNRLAIHHLSYLKPSSNKITQFNKNSADGTLLSVRDLAFTLNSRFLKHLHHHNPRQELLNFIHHKAQSMLPKLYLYKATTIPQYDIIAFSETSLNSKIPDQQANIENFSVYRSDGSDPFKSNGGGSALYIQNNITHRHRSEFSPRPGSEFDAGWVHLTSSNSHNLTTVSMNVPPAAKTDLFLHFLTDTLNEPTLNRDNLLLFNDFNCNWNNSYTFRSKLSYLSEQSNLQMNVQRITYVSAANEMEQSLLDLRFSSIQLSVHQRKILLTQLSDYYAITCRLKI